jgi:hypothetical protein
MFDHHQMAFATLGNRRAQSGVAAVNAPHPVVAIVGSRRSVADVPGILDALCIAPAVIVSGGADGVDRDAERYAVAVGLPMRRITPDYDRYGDAAPHVRNRQIVDCADVVIAVWDAIPWPGNALAIVRRAQRRGIPVHCYTSTGPVDITSIGAK